MSLGAAMTPRRIALAALLALPAIALVCWWLTWITKENFDAHL